MKMRDITIWLVCILLASVLFIVAGLQLDYINSQRKEMRLIINEPLENAPPSLAFATVAMGAFRGLVVDILWMRADRLKSQGQFFDAKQLAEWITVLQPRFSEVWEFQAWNMAYNISVAIPATQPEERWRWVKNGYELLRDRAIPLNPKSILLYQALSRILMHKIGSVSDDAHKFYKLKFVLAIQPLLGPADEQYFKRLAETPADWQKIANDPNISPIIKALKAADNVFLDEDKFVGNYLSLRQNPARFKPQAFAVIDNFRKSKALDDFDIFAKAYQLRHEWKLDPVFMQELNHTYGPIPFNDPNKHLPLDWCHPDTHAIYWAALGLKVASKKEYSANEANTNRMVAHSLQDLFRNGKIYIYQAPKDANDLPIDPRDIPMEGKQIYLRPDLRMFEPYNQALLKIIEKYEDPNTSSYASNRIGHRNMLKDVSLSFYQAGHTEQAQRIYNQLRKLYPNKEFDVPLVVYAKKRFQDELKIINLKDAQDMVNMLLRESYFRYAMRDDDEAFNSESLAKQIHDYYQKKYSDENRINLPEFKMVKYFALTDFFDDASYPLSLRQTLLARIKIERPKLAEEFMQIEQQLIKESEESGENEQSQE